MKSEQEWASELHGKYQSALMADGDIEAIREEMRQECRAVAQKAVQGKAPHANLDASIRDAILNAGKPTLRKGQLVMTPSGDVAAIRNVTPAWGDCTPLQWSDLCGSAGLFPNHAGDGPVFLKEAME